MSVNSAMTAIADKIRTLLGISGTMGLDGMSANLQTAVTTADTQADLIARIETALEGKMAASSAASVDIDTAIAFPSTNTTSISFDGLPAEPKMFCICPIGNISSISSTRTVLNVVFDGNNIRGVYTNGTTAAHSESYFRWSYSNGTLVVSTSSTTNGGYFRSFQYMLVYVV